MLIYIISSPQDNCIIITKKKEVVAEAMKMDDIVVQSADFSEVDSLFVTLDATKNIETR